MSSVNAGSLPDSAKASGWQRWQIYALTGLSLSIGWGIRGNFGHEWGAAMPGALAAMAAVLMSGRTDWLQRIPLFALFGALGWSFGGSMSYGLVIGYTQSGDTLSVLYGFGCLFVIGFLWGAVGGAGTALPAYCSRAALAQFFAPLACIFLVWWAEGAWEARWLASSPTYQERSPLDWYDTDWISVLLAILVVGARTVVRRRLEDADRWILHMAVGWWVGFLLLTVLLGLRMTPPRSDNWSGSLGMVAGIFVHLTRQRQWGLLYATLWGGIIGGIGFAGAQLIKLVLMKTGWSTNWHSVMEQTYGLINGLGIVMVMEWLRVRAPRWQDQDEQRVYRWSDAVAVSAVLLLLTYVNLQRMVDDWLRAKAVPESILFLTARGWFDLFYALTAAAFLWVMREHLKRPLPLIPGSPLGRGQMLYLVFLWWIVTGNFMRALVAFSPDRLITEGVIHVNALLCSVWALLRAYEECEVPHVASTDYTTILRRGVVAGMALLFLTVLSAWGITRALYGDTVAGGGKKQIRFNTTTTPR
ncbi:MAG: hypothetical protein RMJ43_14625 [Chloroherpetonaceae bacterium]|nr:hypothetical protein [Chthonomonadaceae bacterium]MDW8209067.1 hypothetical protein [Chloroherpetonaceae bacterium]